ncbi:hypothetical protein ACIGHF_11410 [Stenotrophomonas sp. NPDC077464]|uniref:hypothetical protein n=1 Tax=unclassified Stenotrophomonas TaxID=196198 RepID=UPI0037CEF0DB
MPHRCLALLLSLASACTLPGSPVTVRVSLPPQPDLCVRYRQEAPVCVAAIIAWVQPGGARRDLAVRRNGPG